MDERIPLDQIPSVLAEADDAALKAVLPTTTVAEALAAAILCEAPN